MRHHKKGRKFNRKTGPRRSFMRNLASDLIRRGKISTTEARAKELRPYVEKLVTIAKRGTLAGRRLVMSRIHNEQVTHKLCDDVAPKYKERNGGYLRIIKTAKMRKRDGVRVATIEFV